jgi:xanthosine utilization system XapX-like protein
MIEQILSIGAGLLVGIVAALKLIAPRTKNTVDDKVLAYADKVLGLLPGSVKGAVEAGKDKVEADKTKA